LTAHIAGLNCSDKSFKYKPAMVQIEGGFQSFKKPPECRFSAHASDELEIRVEELGELSQRAIAKQMVERQWAELELRFLQR